MNDLTTFSKPEFGQLRTVEINGTPWLVGKDVAIALGYKNPQRAIRDHVDTEDQGVTKTGDAHHQRIRPVQPDFEQQDAQGKGL